MKRQIGQKFKYIYMLDKKANSFILNQMLMCGPFFHFHVESMIWTVGLIFKSIDFNFA